MSYSWISDGAKQRIKLFPVFRKTYGTNIALFTSSRKKGLGFVASDSKGRHGGVAEISDGETAPRSYVWPDKKVALFVLLKKFARVPMIAIESIVMRFQLYLWRHDIMLSTVTY